jgi:hypothetical protein
VGAGDRFCAHCGADQAGAAEGGGRGVELDEPAPLRNLECQNCGSHFVATADQRSYKCPFCETDYVVEFTPEESSRRRPDFVIGFAITAQEAYDHFRAWIGRNGWFRPADLEKAEPSDRFKGVYVPFWSFSMLAQSTWSARIGEYWYRTETYHVRNAQGKMEMRTRTVQETEWWPLEGRHHAYYHGYLVSGSRGLRQSEADAVNPFHLPAMQRYEPYFLAGWLSEEYSIDDGQAREVCHKVFLEREYSNVAAFLPGDEHQDLAVDTKFSKVNVDLCLLPVYLMNYVYRGKPYRFIINGQTGKISGQKPISGKRVWAAIIIALSLIAGIALAVAALNR